MSSKITIVADAGSCWLGRMDYAKRLIDTAKDAKVDVCKFQLFEGQVYRDAGNIEMRLDVFKDLYNYGKTIGMPVTASAFNKQSLELLTSMDVHHIKFAYSMRGCRDWIQGALNIGKRVVVTTNINDAYDLPRHDNLIKLVTQPRCKHADEYPITTKMNFDQIFPWRFQGFSDHSLGFLEAQMAVSHGAVWIEKHFRLEDGDCDEVPDGRFALNPKELKEFVWKVQK